MKEKKEDRLKKDLERDLKLIGIQYTTYKIIAAVSITCVAAAIISFLLNLLK